MKRSLLIIHWAPRLICILAILFVSMFALDAFDPKLTLGQQIMDFLIHLIPSYFLIFFLIVAWKWELIGGLILIAFALGFLPSIFIHNYHMNHSIYMSLVVILIINVPFIIAGALFVLGHFLKRKNQTVITE
jgi:hypothetical protein